MNEYRYLKPMQGGRVFLFKTKCIEKKNEQKKKIKIKKT